VETNHDSKSHGIILYYGKIYRAEAGSVYLSFETNQLEETLHWILEFCGYVKVLNPPILKEKMIEAAERVLRNAK